MQLWQISRGLWELRPQVSLHFIKESVSSVELLGLKLKLLYSGKSDADTHTVMSELRCGVKDRLSFGEKNSKHKRFAFIGK